MRKRPYSFPPICALPPAAFIVVFFCFSLTHSHSLSLLLCFLSISHFFSSFFWSLGALDFEVTERITRLFAMPLPLP